MSQAAAAYDALRAAAQTHPGWRDHAPLLEAVSGRTGGYPGARALTALLPDDTHTQSGHAVRFRDASTLPAVDYERHVHATGEVPTRSDDLHDLANALAWARWPRLKAAINAAHCRALAEGASRAGRRGPRRDALTVFDESGAVVASPRRALLDALARHDWNGAFREQRAAWRETRVFVFGHAVLEKLVAPFKGITVHALLVETEPGWRGGDREGALRELDAGLARGVDAGALLRDTGALSPLPVAGIPGGWSGMEARDDAFYDDPDVFRPPTTGRTFVTPIRWPLDPGPWPD